jgi:hypothetical protein
MKNLKFILLLALFAINLGCSIDDDSPKEQEQQSKNFQFTTIKVVLPEGANLDVTKTKVLAYSEKFDISSSGNSKIYFNKNNRSLAVLLDENDQPVLMGFITDTQKEISIKSTVEASYYFGLGAIFQPEETRERFFENSNNLKGISEFIEESKALFNSDVQFMTSQNYSKALKLRLEAFTADRDTLDIGSKTIEVDKNDIKSGLQIEEVDFETMLVVNSYRRRAHGFIYKTATTDLSGTQTILVNDIVDENPPFKSSFSISSAKAIRGFTGVLQDWASGADFAVTKSKNQQLELNDNEKQATYKVRVIGPSFTLGNITNAEETQLRRLEWETLGYDLVLPLMLDAIGHTKTLKGFNETKFKPFLDVLINFASSIESVHVPLRKGDYSKALKELLFAMGNNQNSSNVEDMVKALIDGILEVAEGAGSTLNVQQSQDVIKNVKFLFKTLEITDVFLKLIDYNRIVFNIESSNMLEEWKVKAKRTDVTLTPKFPTAIPFNETPINAIVKDTEIVSGQIFQYEWKTSGKYGILKGDGGREGASINIGSTESRNLVNYYSTSNELDLPKDATDTIIVDVYVKEGVNKTKIGSDTITVNIRSYKFVIKPDGATIKGDTDLALYIQKPDGSNQISSNQELDFKIVWTTTAKHGVLNGSSNNLTNYNDNRIIYSCFDTTAINSQEIITVRVYGKLKSATEYSLYDEINVSVNIDNSVCENIEESVFKANIEIAGVDTREINVKHVIYSPNVEGAGSLLISARVEADGKFTSASIRLRTFNYKGVGTYPVGEASGSNEGWDALVVFNENSHWISYDPPSGSITITEECTTYIKGTFNITVKQRSSTGKAEINSGEFVINF